MVVTGGHAVDIVDRSTNRALKQLADPASCAGSRGALVFLQPMIGTPILGVFDVTTGAVRSIALPRTDDVRVSSDNRWRASRRSLPSAPAASFRSVRVMVNGEVVEAGDDADLAALLEQLGLTKRLVVVELNGQPVARSAVASTSLRDGDRLEVVRAVAGG